MRHSKLTTISSGNGLAPGRRQAIIWINAGILLIGPSGANFSEILIEIQTSSFNKMHFENVACEMAAILSRPQRVFRRVFYNCNSRIYNNNNFTSIMQHVQSFNKDHTD